MPGSTTKYAFPYPLGTDPISDGDDQIKALAERVEAVLSGTGGGALTRAWATSYSLDQSFPANSTYTGLFSVVLTGCPIGVMVAVPWSVILASPAVAGALTRVRVSSTGISWLVTPVTTYFNAPTAAAAFATHAGFAIGTTTAAAPTIQVEGLATGGGNATIAALSTALAYRIT